MLKDGMLLYHGSYAAIDTIDLSKCVHGKDFGKGFYLTENHEQARNFIANSIRKARNTNTVSVNQNYGFVSVFKYHKPAENLLTYTFETADRDWLWYVSMNRRTDLAERFKHRLDEKLINAEIVIGKIANDTTNPTIAAYLSGLYGDVESDMAVNFAISQLMPERLKNQFCFRTERAVKSLEKVEVLRYDQ